MDAVLAAIQLITQPPGDIVFFLVTLFALQQAWIISVTNPRSAPRHRRWQWALSLMLLQRAALIILGLLSSSGVISPLRYLPALESLIDVSGLLLLAWAALFAGRERKWQTISAVVLLVIYVIFFVITAENWFLGSSPSSLAPYTLTGFARVWTFTSLIIAFLMLVAAMILRPVAWNWLVGTSLFWFLGAMAQFLYPLSQNHVSGWQRLASLITYPLLAILVQRHFLSAPAPVIPTPSVLLHKPTINVLYKIQSARDLDPALIVASSDIARLLDARVCAVLLQPDDDTPLASEELTVTEDSPYHHLRVVAVHPLNAAQLDTPNINLTDYELIQQVLNNRQGLGLRGDTELASLCPLFSELGITVVESLVLLPLHHNGRSLGIILIGDPDIDMGETGSIPDTFGKLGVLLGAAIAHAQYTTPQGDMMQRVTSNLALATGSAMQLSSQQETALKEKISELKTRLQAREEEISLLNTELHNLTQHTSAFEQQIWQEEIRKLADEREYMEKQVTGLTRDRDLLLSERDLLSTELDELRRDVDSLTFERDQYRAQVQAMIDTQTNSKTVSQSGTVGLLIANQDGTITMADAVARKLLQLPNGDVVGIPLNGAFADPYWTQAVDSLLSVEGVQDTAHITLQLDEEIIEAELASLRGNDGKADGLAVVLRSSESNAELLEAIVNQTSEFRTPMTAITGYTDLLLGEQGGILTGMQRQFLERVKANVEQMNHQLNDLVRMTSPDKRPVELSPQPVNLIEIIEEAIMGLAARFRERKLVVQLDLPPELARVRADRDSLYQIMVRLISNAALCSQQGSQITISASEDQPDAGAYVRISVADTGSGIAPEDYPRVFRKFYRANHPTIQGMGETGVGMAVAKTLVEANNGRIWVESDLGQGSTFSFLLPAETMIMMTD